MRQRETERERENTCKRDSASVCLFKRGWEAEIEKEKESGRDRERRNEDERERGRTQVRARERKGARVLPFSPPI